MNLMPCLLFLKMQQYLKLSSAANYRWRFMGNINWSVKSQNDKVVLGNHLRNKCGHLLPFDASEIKSRR